MELYLRVIQTLPGLKLLEKKENHVINTSREPSSSKFVTLLMFSWELGKGVSRRPKNSHFYRLKCSQGLEWSASQLMCHHQGTKNLTQRGHGDLQHQ